MLLTQEENIKMKRENKWPLSDNNLQKKKKNKYSDTILI